jgi:hypothetical protein
LYAVWSLIPTPVTYSVVYTPVVPDAPVTDGNTTTNTTILPDDTPTAAPTYNSPMGPFDVPLGSFGQNGNWSLLSLLLTILSVISAFILVLRTARQNKQREKAEYEFGTSRRKSDGKAFVLALIAVLVTAATLIAWLVLDNLSLPMAWVNGWTPIILAGFVIHLVLVIARTIVLGSDGHNKDGDDNEQQPAASF